MKKPNKCKTSVVQPKKQEFEKIKNEKHFSSVVAAFPEAFVNGKFCDVKIVCMVCIFFQNFFHFLRFSCVGHRFVGAQNYSRFCFSVST